MPYNYYPQYYAQNQMYQNAPVSQQQMQNQGQMQQTPISQTNGIISAPNEEFARNYPVAYGNSVTFRDENIPYLYTKTMGFSQMERPKFEKYKLVKEDSPETSEETVVHVDDSKEAIEKIKLDIVNSKVDIDNLKADVDDLKSELEDALLTIASLKKKLTNAKKVAE